MIRLILIIIILLPSLAFGQPKSNWPTTLDQAVNMLIEHISDQEKIEISQTIEEGLVKYHFNWGTGIRNEFGLWEGNKKLLASCGSEGMHPDEASGVIIHGVWSKLRSKLPPNELKAYENIERYLRRVTVASCEEDCENLEKAVSHINESIDLSDLDKSIFMVVLKSEEPYRETHFAPENGLPLYNFLSALEFRTGLKSVYDPPYLILTDRDPKKPRKKDGI